jgi:hypothetical protein
MKGGWLVSLLLLLFAPQIQLCEAKEISYDLSASIKESRKQNAYLRTVSVTPRVFCWNNHRIEVFECWLEQSPVGENTLIFRLKVDGKVTGEHRLARKEDLFFYFIPKGEVKKNEGRFRVLPPSSILFLPFGAYTEYVHYIRFKGAEIPELLKLDFHTETSGLHPKVTATNIQLEFELKHGESDCQR